MSFPYPFKSSYNPANDYTNIDYSMTSPLLADGSNFPCKGYHTVIRNGNVATVDTITAGKSYTVRYVSISRITSSMRTPSPFTVHHSAPLQILPLNLAATVLISLDADDSFAGTATHGGGSCQFSLSYDGGNTWAVIHSIIGGCPLNSAYTFSVPTNIPSGNALFAWTWFNKLGNRYSSIPLPLSASYQLPPTLPLTPYP